MGLRGLAFRLFLIINEVKFEFGIKKGHISPEKGLPLSMNINPFKQLAYHDLSLILLSYPF
jgi:hypothetical protein